MNTSPKALPPSKRVLQSTALVAKLATTLPSAFIWTSDFHPTELNIQSIQWMFCIDLINFSFWDDPPYAYQSYTGYNAFCMQFKHAHSQYPLTQADFMRSISDELFLSLFPGLPMARDRAVIFRETGKTLCEKFDGFFSNVLKQSQRSCQAFIELVLDHFPSFRDEAMYHEHKVYFYKRAQILSADLHHLYLANKQCLFDDIDQLTIFADYRLPQILHHLHLLTYSEELQSRLREVWKSGDPMEVEIRAMSIQAAERLKLTLEKQEGRQILGMDLDFFLWKLAKSTDLKVDFHRVRCCFY